MAKKKYTEKDIQVVEGLQHIRHRPKMYIGELDPMNLVKLISEDLDTPESEYRNAVFTITAEGPELSYELHPKVNKPIAELMCTIIGCGSRIGELGWLVVVNALSEYLIVESIYKEKLHRMRFHRANLQSYEVVEKSGPPLRLVFKPDPKIFDDPTQKI